MSEHRGQDISLSDQATKPIAGVAFPMAVSGVYDYRIPAALLPKVMRGTAVLVELRSRRTWGVVVALRPESSIASLKEIIAIRAENWADASGSLIRLYEWIAEYYQCDLGRVFRPLISKGLSVSRERTHTVYETGTATGSDLTPAQAIAWNLLRSHRSPLTMDEIRKRFAVSRSVVAALCKKACLIAKRQALVRESDECKTSIAPERVVLTSEQQQAAQAVIAQCDRPGKPFLLYGITGSGKTHVYTEICRHVLACGKSAIILVPEIALTPQTIMRFRAAVGDVVAVIHSQMSAGERRDALQELVTGAKRLVIGVRSAILAPMDNLGLIIVDEEHDASYKQNDRDPRYNAREVAIMRGHFQKSVVVLGSATPSLESFYNAKTGKFALLELRERFGPACLPAVHIIDMNRERRANNWTILSRQLESRMAEVLAAKRQIILLLNRRGYSVILLCKECGYAHHCPNCSITLRYHRSDLRLKCHVCGFAMPAPDVCPVCRGDQMKYKGTGIQKAEELIRSRFPEARILRMDRDTTRRKGAHHRLLHAFAQREADILLGTQMVAKGLNFPGVALVGVIQADTGLLFPDFRASERTFQLLTQVSGRAGRSDSAGEVIIQTCYPDDPSVRFSGSHDYEGFYESEIPHRRELAYPPFSRIARIVVEAPHESMARMTIEEMGAEVAKASPAVMLLGPSPAVMFKLKGGYRFSLLLKSHSSKHLAAALARARSIENRSARKTRIVYDVDPVNML
ncbi:MAG: primosomal protein N' [Chitinispirillaceae bacterium]|nr:primosomal protein N' [Chitinispirillaceae bacterium]